MSHSDRTPTHSPIRFRRGGPQDAALIDGMIHALAAGLGTPLKVTASVADFIQALSTSPPRIHAVIAESEDAPAGLCLWFPYFSTWRGQSGLFIQDLYVAPHMRGSGLGAGLLRAALEQAGELSPRFLRLSVNHTNEAARGFYARLGFSEFSDEAALDLHGDAFDALRQPLP